MAEEKPAQTKSPNRQEVWVPTEELGKVLRDYPRAVLLSREQYEQLLREAEPHPNKLPAPPREAALTSAQYTGRVEGETLTVQATLTVQVLAEEWTRLPLPLDGLTLGEVKVDGEGTVALPKITPAVKGVKISEASVAQISPTLLLRGKGEHQVALTFSTPVSMDELWHQVSMRLPTAGATSLNVDLPAQVQVESDQPVRIETTPAGTRAIVAPAHPGGEATLRWRFAGNGLTALPPSVISSTRFCIDAEKVDLDSYLAISTATGVLPETLEMELSPETQLQTVTGDNLAAWSVEGQRLRLTLTGNRGSTIRANITAHQPTNLGATEAQVSLSAPRLVGAGRVEGRFTVLEKDGVLVRDLAEDPAITAMEEGGAAKEFIGTWNFRGANVTPRIRVERLRPHFHADLDTLIDFQPEAIFLERTVTLHPREGGLYNLLLTLPAGEELLEVRGSKTALASAQAKRAPQNTDPLWTMAGGRLSLRWLNDPAPGQPRTVWLRTRTEPSGWSATVNRNAAMPATATGDLFVFPVAEVKIEGSEKVSGYLALRAGENLRLEPTPDDTLEPRDGRTTPVTGAFAWFRRGEFALKVGVTRRPSEVLANLTGYALPLAGVLDVHAQVAYDFRYSGVRSVQVRVPAGQADLFYFDHPQIAERTLAGDVWTISFQKDLTGPQSLTVTGQIPIAPDAKDASRFSTALPLLEPLQTQRVSGTWVVEANTDTEIQLTATGMTELDALLAPPLPGYQPRHRVIGVFSWLGTQYGLSLSGVRHASAPVLTTVVDKLELTSVAATTGLVRTEATLQIRTAGAQFVDAALPAGARLLSLLVDDQPSKPVEGRPGDVRVQLPAKEDRSTATKVVLLYEQKASPEWRGRGQSTLAPLQLPSSIPILQTTWRAYLPEGYYYSGATTSLTPAPPRLERPLLLAPLAVRDYFSALRAQQVLASSGIADPRDPTEGLTPEQRQQLQRLKRLNQDSFDEEPVDFAAGATGFAEVQSHDYAEYERSKQKSASVNVPRVEFREATVTEAVKFLNEKAAVHGLSVTMARGSGEGEKMGQQKITVSLGDISLFEVCGFVARYAGGKTLVQPGGIKIVPNSTPDLLYHKSWAVSEPFKREAAKFPKTNASSGTGQRLNAQEYLANMGVAFPSGGSALYDPATGRLSVTSTAENIELIETEVGGPSPNEHEAPRRRQSTARIQNKLDTILIPRLEFREATVREAVDFLVQKSRQLDLTEPDPAKRGINIVLRLDELIGTPALGSATPIAPGSIPGLDAIPGESATPGVAALPAVAPSEARITVSLSDIPLREALRYVTNLAGLKFKVTGNAVEIVPLATPTDSLITKEWRVEPTFLSNLASASPGIRMDAMGYLKSTGITFPPGSSAVFLPGSAKLIVRNTQENLELVDYVLEPSMAISITAADPYYQLSGDQSRKVGLLPMRLELPLVGEKLEVSGYSAPEPLRVQYFAQERRTRSLWTIFFVGVIAYFVCAGRHPWWRTVWVALGLTAIPLCLSADATVGSNLLLGGWLVALVVGRLARRFIFARKEEVPA